MEFITSAYSFDDTLSRVEQFLSEHDLKLFAKIDHAQEAKQALLAMDKATVLIFGSPKAGTLLMQANIQAALELPLKLLICEQETQCHMAYHIPSRQLSDYHLGNPELIGKMDMLFQKITEVIS